MSSTVSLLMVKAVVGAGGPDRRGRTMRCRRKPEASRSARKRAMICLASGSRRFLLASCQRTLARAGRNLLVSKASGVTRRDPQFLGDLIEAEPKSDQPVYRGQPVEGQVPSGVVLDGVEQRPLAIVKPALDESPGPSQLGWRQDDVRLRAGEGVLREHPSWEM